MIADVSDRGQPDAGPNTPLGHLVARYSQVTSIRRPWEYHWQELRDLVNPHGSDFNRFSQPGARKTDLIFDGTACWALEQLAAGLHSFCTSPTDRWFNLGVRGYDFMGDRDALEWLENVADAIYQCYNNPATNVNDSLHEAYMDLGSFGTACVYQDYDVEEKHLCFRTFPLADCRILENSRGYVDGIWRDMTMTTRMIRQQFPKENWGRLITKESNEDRMFKVIHCVFPRTDRLATKMNAKNKPFASFYFSIEAQAVFSEGGYDEFPWHVPRWAKRAGEHYGRSPAMTCLPDIKMLQAMERAMITSVQKIVDPPLLVPNDGFMLPIQTSPASLIFYDNAAGDNNMIKPLETKGQVEVGEDKMNQKRDYIMKCFYADWLQRAKKKERQTATEITDDRNEMLQMMSPILGRLHAELYGPMITRTYNLLNKYNHFPPAPASLQKKKLFIEYISPAAIAQLASKGTTIKAYMEEVAEFAQVMPDVLDCVDPDKLTQEMSIIQNVSRRIFRDPEEVKKIRAERQKQQQAQQAAETAQPAAKAAKDMSAAGQQIPMGMMQ